MDESFGSKSSSRTSSRYKNSQTISPPVQNHLKKVYLTLCCAMSAAAVGAFLHVVWNIGGIFTTLAFLKILTWLLSMPLAQEQKKRVSLLMASALLQGASIGFMIDFVISIDPRVVIFKAFVGTSLVFACFSGAALVARRRDDLYLGALLSSGFSILIWLHFSSSLFGVSTSLFKIGLLYLGLLMSVVLVIGHTQIRIERPYSGDLDYAEHALALFGDWTKIFILIFLTIMPGDSDVHHDSHDDDNEEVTNPKVDDKEEVTNPKVDDKEGSAHVATT